MKSKLVKRLATGQELQLSEQQLFSETMSSAFFTAPVQEKHGSPNSQGSITIKSKGNKSFMKISEEHDDSKLKVGPERNIWSVLSKAANEPDTYVNNRKAKQLWQAVPGRE